MIALGVLSMVLRRATMLLLIPLLLLGLLLQLLVPALLQLLMSPLLFLLLMLLLVMPLMLRDVAVIELQLFLFLLFFCAGVAVVNADAVSSVVASEAEILQQAALFSWLL